MVNLVELAEKLDAEEKLKVRYRFPKQSGDGVAWVVRCGKLLDIEEERSLLFVSQDNDVVWIKSDEAVEVLPDDGDYD